MGSKVKYVAIDKGYSHLTNRQTLQNGHIEIDNNGEENAIRTTVIGRKNWIFSVSEVGAKARDLF